MQTCPSLRFLPSLRAVSPGQIPRRQRPRPMKLRTLEWKGASPLPNLPRPTCSIGWRAGLTRRQYDRGTLSVLGLLAALSARRRRTGGPFGPVPHRVCRAALVRQTAPSIPHSGRPGVAGQGEGCEGARRAGRQTGPHTPHPCGCRRGLRSMLAGPGGVVSAACPSLLEG